MSARIAQPGDARVLFVFGAEDVLVELRFVDLKNLFDFDDACGSVAVRQNGLGGTGQFSGLLRTNGEDDGDAPGLTAGEMHRLC